MTGSINFWMKICVFKGTPGHFPVNKARKMEEVSKFDISKIEENLP